ncbi:hypothetical protein ACWGBH_10965 [Streptomyces massasporeus]
MLTDLFSLGKQAESLTDEPIRHEGFPRSFSVSLIVRSDRQVVRAETESVRQWRDVITGASCSCAREVNS